MTIRYQRSRFRGAELGFVRLEKIMKITQRRYIVKNDPFRLGGRPDSKLPSKSFIKIFDPDPSPLPQAQVVSSVLASMMHSTSTLISYSSLSFTPQVLSKISLAPVLGDGRGASSDARSGEAPIRTSSHVAY